MEIFLPEEYFTGNRLFKWFILGGTLQTLYWIVNPFLIVFDKKEFFIYITIISAVSSITLNLIFTKNGIEYAAIIYFQEKFKSIYKKQGI